MTANLSLRRARGIMKDNYLCETNGETEGKDPPLHWLHLARESPWKALDDFLISIHYQSVS